jgi:protein O-GlcNAc transferase
MMADHSLPNLAALLSKATGYLADRLPQPALAILTPASTSHPTHADLAARHADALQLAGRLAEAEAEYRRALALAPESFEPWYGLGSCLVARTSYGAAIDALNQALQRQPGHAAARGNLAEALFQTGSVDLAIEQFRRAAAHGDAAMKALLLRNVAVMIPGSPAADNAAVLEVRRAWSASLPRGIAPAATPSTGRKLRIAYVSGYFGSANWMKPVFTVINRHDRSRFEVHMIADGAIPTGEAGYRDHEADVVWRVRNRSNASLAEKIAEVGIDILIDLNGYSVTERLGLFALRPAPVQLGWFNMFATTGTGAYDALIGDASVLPPEEELHYSEPILRVPGSYLAFEVPYAVPDVEPPPALAADFITFGSLCSAIKLTDPVIAAWARILHGVPTARLLLRHGTLEDASNQTLLRARFAAEGIGPDRLVLEGAAPHHEFLATYGRIDIALDTFPYNGGTTTTEALWQGVPVLAFNGDRWASRTSRSLLLAAGLADWVADDVDEFVARAITLAGDPGTPARLAALRISMRDRLLGSAVCDTAGLCAALESIYEAEYAKRLVPVRA